MALDYLETRETRALRGAKLQKVLKSNIEQVPLTSDEKSIIDLKVSTIEQHLHNSSVKKPVILEALTSIRNILEGTAGSIIASGLIYQLGLFLPK